MVGQTLDSWAQIRLDDGLVTNEALRVQIRRQVQDLIRGISLPWKTVGLTPQPVATLVMDVLQQELDDAPHSDWYHTASLKCLHALCKAQSIVLPSLYLQGLTREGANPVAGGGFADIWKGHLQDTQVCLKVLRIFVPEKDKPKLLRSFCQEALVWRQLRHPNVLPFLGVSEDLFAPRYCLVSPWMGNGNVMSYLQAHPDHDRLTSLNQIAEGMRYLHNHNPPIVHADIRGANILVMDDQSCCLADFGLSLFAESQVLESTSRMKKGSIRWLAPEYFRPDVVVDRAYITARDVYAYGCTVVEIFTGEPPFEHMKNEAAVMLAVLAGRRPLRPQHILQDRLWSLVTKCLTDSPDQRPTAERISKALADGNFLADSLNDGWIGSRAGAITVVPYRSYAIATALLQRPIPMQKPFPGYVCVRPPLTPFSWGRVFPTLQTDYNIYYEGPPDPLFQHRCLFPSCNRLVQAIDICQHLLWAGALRREVLSGARPRAPLQYHL
ncbi:kinase-like domain-containing protein [Armillaria novae-zelandiae]|uniref:Kinase-like domain-containing protein n=1 Tax=Armillaria novae-zelandiae TaxID=153914 RepID=A0AA39U091_9AGAR|nr:kinase-like domain-containing protein [Armillaria novae-zelandiae]